MRWWSVRLACAALAIWLGVASASADGGDYVVGPGDTLTSIAARFGTNADALARANDLRSPNRISIGQRLAMPGVALQLAGPTEVATGGGSGAAGYYDVARGDTMDAIAYQLGVSLDDLVVANNLLDPDLLQVGQRLIVPSVRTGTGVSGDATAPAIAMADGSRLVVPYRTQFDGSRYADSNCGPATLVMLMGAFDEWWSADGIRRDVNAYTGDWSLDGGASWESLVYAARKRGFLALGLYEGKGYRRWTLDDLVAEVRAGHAPMLLVRFKNLPGHLGSTWWGDHYIIFLGLTADGQVLYHDSAFYGSGGAYRQMSKDQLMRAWSTNAAGIQYSAMVLRWALSVE